MKFQHCSDLHLEWPRNRTFLKENPLTPSAEVLILAGDVIELALLDEPCDFLNWVSDNFRQTYWVPGNHDFYGGDIDGKMHLREDIKPNVHLVNNVSVMEGDVQLFFSTLFGEIRPQNIPIVWNGIKDFIGKEVPNHEKLSTKKKYNPIIKYRGEMYTPIVFNELHAECMNFLNREIMASNHEKKIVVTHHAPTLMNYPSKYKDRNYELNEFFAVELFDFIESSGVDAWVYGHTHHNTDEFKIETTRLLTNQLGYIHLGGGGDFNHSATFEL